MNALKLHFTRLLGTCSATWQQRTVRQQHAVAHHHSTARWIFKLRGSALLEPSGVLSSCIKSSIAFSQAAIRVCSAANTCTMSVVPPMHHGLQDEAIASGSLDIWRDIVPCVDQEVVCAWSEDARVRHCAIPFSLHASLSMRLHADPPHPTTSSTQHAIPPGLVHVLPAHGGRGL